MTHKEHIQQQMLYEIKSKSSKLFEEDGVIHEFKYDELAQSCTSIAEQCMGEFAEWASNNFVRDDCSGKIQWMSKNDTTKNYADVDLNWYNTKELVQLFLNQNIEQ